MQAFSIVWFAAALLNAQTISTYVGTRAPEGQSAISTSLFGVAGLAADSSGNVYFAENHENVIYRIQQDGTLKRFAGTGWYSGSLDDGFAARDSRLLNPTRIRMRPDGSLYFYDVNRIRRVNSTNGLIETIVQNSQLASRNEILLGAYAFLSNGDLIAVAVHAQNGIVLLRIRANAVISETALTGWTAVQDLAVDGADNVLALTRISGSQSVWRVNLTNGNTTRIAGTVVPSESFGDLPPLETTIAGAYVLNVDPTQNIWIGGELLQRIDADTGIMRHLAGTLERKDDDDLSNLRNVVISVTGIQIFLDGTVLLANYDGQGQIVRLIDGRFEVVAGSSNPIDTEGKTRQQTRLTTAWRLGRYPGGGIALQSSLTRALLVKESEPTRLLYDSGGFQTISRQSSWTFDPQGNVYLAWPAFGPISKADPATNTFIPRFLDPSPIRPYTYVDEGTSILYDDGLLYAQVGLYTIYRYSGGTFSPLMMPPYDLLTSYWSGPVRADGNGNLYWMGRGGIARYSKASGERVLAFQPTGEISAFDVDEEGNIYYFHFRLVDGNYATEIWRFDQSTGSSTRMAGGIGTTEVEDGPSSGASVNSVQDLIYSNGALYFTEPQRVRKIQLPAQPRYAGYVDSANCQTISGWAADKNRSGVSIPISIYDGAVLIATVNANLSRSDVGGLLGDNGLHGFSYQVPASLRDGNTHNIQVVYESNIGMNLPGAPRSLTCATVYAGYVEKASCGGVTGWAADRGRLNQPITVTLWAGATQIASALANGGRPDVGAVIGDNGQHGFSLAIPPAYADGANHAFQVRFETSASQIPGSPVTLTCGGTNYAGYIDSASCSGITGWAADRNRPGQALIVSLWDGANQLTSTTANALRSDVGAAVGDNGLHGFSLALPASYANGTGHTLQVRYENSTVQLPGSPVTLTCGGTRYAGYQEASSCNGITGWMADRNRPNQSLVASLWQGSTQIASTTANGPRPDVGAAIGDNGLHGFRLVIPAATADGKSHSLQVRYEDSLETLGAPITVTCGTSANYSGWLDHASCDAVSGWAVDKSRLNQPISVDILDGASIAATLLANASRPDVGSLVHDNGLHGFSFPTPLSLKDGKAHTIQVRFNGTSIALSNSPQTLQCTAGTASLTGYVETASCTAISGWAADRNALNTAIMVEVYDGATLLGSVEADALRTDVGTAIGDNGFHAFSFPTPVIVKDGKTHTIVVRPAGSVVALPGAQSLTCAQ